MLKKIYMALLLAIILVAIYPKERLLWSHKLLTNDPIVHTVQKGENFSKLSQLYYGTTQYWRELALINRAPNADLLYPGERIIIPSDTAIKNLAHSKSLTDVNNIVSHQEKALAQYIAQPGVELAAKLSQATSENEANSILRASLRNKKTENLHALESE